MPTHSKFEYGVSSGWKEGGNYGNGGATMDFHVWVARKDTGEVVYDPHFKMYDNVCEIQGCDVDAQMHMPWPNQKKWYKKKVIQTDAVKYCNRESQWHVIENFAMCPQVACCPINAWAYLKWMEKNNQIAKGECEVVVGSMGWRKKGKEEVWWEFG
jgi:hypothetical protein